MPGIANATKSERDEHAPGMVIEITDDMVSVAAKVLMEESSLDLMTEGWAEGIARKMLENALLKVRL
jgi:hypothetical protein